ncbi:MAG: type II toxin-antitoxin system RelE/ParE family toxin [Holosporales bacterium]|jgi:mRNA interferase RelE/StbE|nr:type II toxin-antitoxin system RelE/ParE family toxin [Holosporales bacterium]
MAYIVNYLETAKWTYFKLIPADKKLLIKRVIEERLTQDPQAFGKPLRGSLKGHYRLRIEDYRIIYRVNGNVVLVIAIGHRKDIYNDYR